MVYFHPVAAFRAKFSKYVFPTGGIVLSVQLGINPSHNTVMLFTHGLSCWDPCAYS